MRVKLVENVARSSFDAELERRLQIAIDADKNVPHEESGRVKVFGLLNEQGEIYRTIATYNAHEHQLLVSIVDDLDLVSSPADSRTIFRAYFGEPAVLERMNGSAPDLSRF